MLERAKAIWRWIDAHWSWLTEERWPWIMLGVLLGVPLVVWFLPGELEPRVRLAAMVLQLCGVVTVALGIRKTRRLFGEESYGERFGAWWGRRPGDRTARLMGAALHAKAGALATAVGDLGWRVAPEGARPEERLAALESNMKQSRKALEEGRQRLDEEVSKRAAAIDAESQARERGDDDVRAVIRAAAAGGLDLSAMGVLWLFAGIILGTASREIACLLGGPAY